MSKLETALVSEFQPVGPIEEFLVQRIFGFERRLQRCVNFEALVIAAQLYRELARRAADNVNQQLLPIANDSHPNPKVFQKVEMLDREKYEKAAAEQREYQKHLGTENVAYGAAFEKTRTLSGGLS